MTGINLSPASFSLSENLVWSVINIALKHLVINFFPGQYQINCRFVSEVNFWVVKRGLKRLPLYFLSATLEWRINTAMFRDIGKSFYTAILF